MNHVKPDNRQSALFRSLGVGRLADFSVDLGAERPQRTLPQFIGWFASIERSTWWRIAELSLLFAAVLLGFFGFQEKVTCPLGPHARPPGCDPEPWRHWQTMLDSAFRTLQLATTQFPREFDKNLPWQLQVARFLVPVLGAYVSLGLILRRFSRPVRAWRAGLSSGHVVLIGESNVSVALAQAFGKAGDRVVAITPRVLRDEATIMELTGAHVVFGDVKRESTLRRAAIHRAKVAIVADDLGTDGVWLASSVARLCRWYRDRDEPLDFLVRLGHRDLRSLLRTQIQAAAQKSHVRLSPYVREQTIARSLLARYPVDWGQPPGPRDIHVAVIGLGYMGSELLLQLVRLAVPLPGRRCVFTVVDREANGLRDQLLVEHSGLLHCADEMRFFQAEISPSAITVDQVAEWLEARPDGKETVPATAIYVCCGNDGANLSMAIGLRKALALRKMLAPPMFVYQSSGKELIEGLGGLHGPTFDTLRIIPFGGIEEEADPFYLVNEQIDDLASQLHASYVSRERKKGVSGPAVTEWKKLDETYRAASRAQADHVLVKLRGAGLHAEPGAGQAGPALDKNLMEELAIQEHDRWSRERRLAGWIHAHKRDNEKLHHPDLVPYDRLDEDGRSKDRGAVLHLVEDLAGLKPVGLTLKRDHRVGIWFDSEKAPSPSLMDEVTRALERAAAKHDRHLQLVLPLRAPAELRIASHLGQAGNAGIDVAIAHSPTAPGGRIGERLANEGNAVARLISVADRAFMLPGPETADDPGPAGDTATLALLCGLCDRVVLACETSSVGEDIARQLDAACRDMIELVHVRI